MRQYFKKARAAFISGFTFNKKSVWYTAILLSVSALAYTEWAVFSGLIFQIPERYLLRDPMDDSTHVSYALNRLATSQDGSFPVYLLGGSSIREATVSNVKLNERLGELGSALKIEKLPVLAHTPIDVLHVIENLPKGEGLLIYGISLLSFSQDPSDYIIRLDDFTLERKSPLLLAVLKEEGISWSPVFLQTSRLFLHFQQWLTRRSGPISQFSFSIDYKGSLYRDHDIPKIVGKALESWLESLEHDISDFKKYKESNLRVLQRAFASAHQKGITVVLLPMPMNRVGSSMEKPILPILQDLIGELAKMPNISVWQARGKVGLTEEDFQDPIHFGDSGKEKFTKWLLANISKFYGQKHWGGKLRR